jgi:P27 family predicted phage terminase small subunit
MRKGGKPKPIEVHKAQGTYRTDRHLPDSASLPVVAAIPLPPETLPRDVHDVWNHQAASMQQMRILTPADYRLLELYCNQFWVYRQAYQKLMNGPLIEKLHGGDGTVKSINPSIYLRIMNDAETRIVKLSEQLGFSPAARTRIAVRFSDDKDPAEGLVR